MPTANGAQRDCPAFFVCFGFVSAATTFACFAIRGFFAGMVGPMLVKSAPRFASDFLATSGFSATFPTFGARCISDLSSAFCFTGGCFCGVAGAAMVGRLVTFGRSLTAGMVPVISGTVYELLDYEEKFGGTLMVSCTAGQVTPTFVSGVRAV